MVLILIVVGIVYWSIWAVKHRARWAGVADALFPPVLFGALIIAIGFIGLAVLSSVTAPVNSGQYTVPLDSLADSSANSGQFFLGSGYMDERRVIDYVYGDNNYGYRTSYIEANHAVIYQQGSAKDAHLTVVSVAGRNFWLIPFQTPNFLADSYYFYVPQGSIINDYRVDSNN